MQTLLETIIAYVNYYFHSCKDVVYYNKKSPCDNLIKSCLVYKYLYAKYFSKDIDMNIILYRLIDTNNNFNSNQSAIMANHLIFSNAFRAFWKQYRMERGCVYVVDSPFQEYETLGLLTGLVYWALHRGVV